MHKANISTNIIRDENSNLNYIVTPNASDIFNTISGNFKNGIRSFTVSGNYGTGKSSFLWASEKNLKAEESYFSDLKLAFPGIKKFRVLKLVGSHHSLIKSFGALLKLDSTDEPEIFDELNAIELRQSKKSEGLAIFIDEFGKFLEFASEHNPQEELFFLQTLAEWANDTNKNVVLVNTIHQNYAAYAKALNKEQKEEWAKISGRFKVLNFNEPIEQLLFFTSERLKNYKRPEALEQRQKSLNQILLDSKLVSSVKNEGKVNLDALYPLDGLSAQVLIKSLDLYGQNERSLFTFLDAHDKFSINQFNGDFFGVDKVFDYLVHTVTNEIASNDNPKKTQWRALHVALDKIELYFEGQDYFIAEHIIKLIGLANMFGSESGSLDEKVIIGYINSVYNQDAVMVLTRIIDLKLIQFFRHKSKFNFVDGTDLDIPQELAVASKEVNPHFKIVDFLKEEIQLPILLAKRHTYLTGSPRFFAYHYCDDLENLPEIEAEVDGFIHLTFDKDITQVRLKNFSTQNTDARLFVSYKNTDRIRNLVFDMKRYKFLIEKFRDDRIAKQMLTDEWNFLRTELEKLVLKDLFSSEKNVQWFYAGKEQKVDSPHSLNQRVSGICDEVYSKAPIFKSELANREILSVPINTARRRLINDLINNETQIDLGYPEDKFPPEKAIYLSLAKITGIHGPIENSADHYGFQAPKEESFKPLWEECEFFLESSVHAKQNLSKLYSVLSEKPFKLKKGFVDFWIPLFLIAHKEDFALFHADNGYVPYLNQTVLDLIHKSPNKYLVKAYNVAGVKNKLLDTYQELLRMNQDIRKGTGSTLISMFGSFYVFYNQLPEYSKKTQKLSAQTIAFREAISNSSDPSSALLDGLPAAFGFHNPNEAQISEAFMNHLKDSIRELRTAYAELLDRVEEQVKSAFDTVTASNKELQDEIRSVLKPVNAMLLTDQYKVMHSQLIGEKPNRESWLQSIADVALRKKVSGITDQEEPLLLKNIEKLIRGITDVIELHKLDQAKGEFVELKLGKISGEALVKRVNVNGNESEAYTSAFGHVRANLAELSEKERLKLLTLLIQKEIGHDEG